MTETYAAVIAALVLTPILSHAFPKEPKSAAAR
jgi:hypothetical protein